MIETQLLKGNLIKQEHSLAFTLNQYDKNISYKINLIGVNGNGYTLDSSDVVTIEWQKPNGQPFLQTSNIVKGDTYITLLTPEAISQIAGTGSYNIIITNGDTRKGTIKREYSVIANSMRSGMTSEDVITDVIIELRELSTTLTETVRSNQEIINNNSAATKQDISNINSSLEDIAKKIPYIITPELYGCKGDGTTDDTTNFLKAVTAAVEYNKDLVLTNSYNINTPLTFEGYRGCITAATGAQIIFSGEFDTKTTKNIIYFKNCNHARIENLAITTDTELTPLETWGKLVFGIELTDCKNTKVVNCEVSKVVDGVSVNGGKNIIIRDCELHELGEEGICVRQCKNYELINNETYNHVGDGFLLKQWTLTDVTNATISRNYFHDGLMQSDNIAFGGGITSNAEWSSDSAGFHENMKIINNKFENVNYGAILIGATNVVVEANSIKNVKKCAIAMDAKISGRNENNLPFLNWIIEKNYIDNTNGGLGISCATARAKVDRVKINNNTLLNMTNRAIQCMNAEVSGNIVEITGNTGIQSFGNCIISKNIVKGGTTGISNDPDATILSINGSSENETISDDDEIRNKTNIIANNKISGTSDYAIYAKKAKITSNGVTDCYKGIWGKNSTAVDNTIENLTIDTTVATNDQHAICLSEQYVCSQNNIKTDVGLIFIRNGSYGTVNNNAIENTTEKAIIFEGIMTKKNYCIYNYPGVDKVEYNNEDTSNPTIIVV